jgi:hypothetical protein
MLNNVMKKLCAAFCLAVVFAGVSCGKKTELSKKASELWESASSGAGKALDSTKGALKDAGEKIESSGAKEAAQQAMAAGSEAAQQAAQQAAIAMKSGLAQAQDAFSKMNADEMLAEIRKMLPKDVRFIPCANRNDAQKGLKELRSKANITKLKFFNLSDGLQVLDAIDFVMNIGKALNPASIALGIAIDLAPEVLTKMGFSYGIFSMPKHIIIIRLEKGDWEFAATT